MAQHVVSAAGPPTEAPPSIGAHYVDTDTGQIYLGNGTASVDDWLLGGGAGSTGGKLYTQGFAETGNFWGFVGVSEDGGRSWITTDESPDSLGGVDFFGAGDIAVMGDVILISFEN